MEGWGGDAGNRRLAGENKTILTTFSVTPEADKQRQLRGMCPLIRPPSRARWRRVPP